jgi:hypothetical protein
MVDSFSDFNEKMSQTLLLQREDRRMDFGSKLLKTIV